MRSNQHRPVGRRFSEVTEKKSGGSTYTPKLLADFVASHIVKLTSFDPPPKTLRILDPAAGDGALLMSLLEHLPPLPATRVEVYGFETDGEALSEATSRVRHSFNDAIVRLKLGSFLEYVLEGFGINRQGNLLDKPANEGYDLIIANPPYVRTHILGSDQRRALALGFGLSGWVDLYHAFLIGIAQVLKPTGIAGVIVSNRFMSTKSGAKVRKTLRENFNIRHVWDLGDTKLFDAAVLPAVLLLEGSNGHKVGKNGFTSIYETKNAAKRIVPTAIDALSHAEVVGLPDGRRFQIEHGTLDLSGPPETVWRVATVAGDAWLAKVEAHSWGTFRDIGKIRVGVKTCADSVFIQARWKDIPEADRPELLKPLTTHRIARRFRALEKNGDYILYPYECAPGTGRVADLSHYPRTRAYLETHRAALRRRKYLIKAGWEWFEIWIHQDPTGWVSPKLVFRDITERPTFWIDLDGTVVNGDCYWLAATETLKQDLLWLAAAVGNSSFIREYYDRRFQNRLYSGRRRFMTQYVEHFPLPDPKSGLGAKLIATAKTIYKCAGTVKARGLEAELDALVWQSFGLPVKKATW